MCIVLTHYALGDIIANREADKRAYAHCRFE